MLGMAIVGGSPVGRSTPRRNCSWAEVFGAYWHLVDLLWVILFPLIYLMRV